MKFTEKTKRYGGAEALDQPGDNYQPQSSLMPGDPEEYECGEGWTGQFPWEPNDTPFAVIIDDQPQAANAGASPCGACSAGKPIGGCLESRQPPIPGHQQPIRERAPRACLFYDVEAEHGKPSRVTPQEV